MNKLYIKDGVVLPKNKIKATKIINGKSFAIFNPSHELLIADGWQPYTPPTPSQPEIAPEQMYKDRVIELVREEYSIDDELAILRQRDSKVDEFNSYNTFVEKCKQQARKEIYG
jgi:hypothetical protein